MAWISNHGRDGDNVATLAARQEGIVTRRQMEALGTTSRQVDRLVRDCYFLPVFHGVYVVGHAAPTPRARMRAAALACPGSVISHRSAAALLGFGRGAPVVVDLIPVEERGRKIDGIKPHRVSYPARSEWGYVHGIPCTIPARTILDLAGTYGENELRDAVERAATERKLDLAAIDAILAGGPKRRGTPCLRRVLAAWRPIAETTRYANFRSLFEAKLLPLIASARLPLPRVNAPVRTAERILEVDFLWERERFVVEADSRRHHGIEVAFDRDRRRDRELAAADYRVLRVTWHEAEREAPAVFAAIRKALADREAAPPRTAAVP